jgi:hypothetical protein
VNSRPFTNILVPADSSFNFRAAQPDKFISFDIEDSVVTGNEPDFSPSFLD